MYLASLGRFMLVDPIEGGTLNTYVYAMDPVNQFDLAGTDLWGDIGNAWNSGTKAVGDAWNATTKAAGDAAHASWKWVGENSENINKALVVGGLAGCLIATAGGCAVVGVATAAVGAGSTVAGARYQGKDWGQSLMSGVVSFGSDMVVGRIAKHVPMLRDFGKSSSRYIGGKTKTFSPKAAARAISTPGGQARAIANTAVAFVQYCINNWIGSIFGSR